MGPPCRHRFSDDQDQTDVALDTDILNSRLVAVFQWHSTPGLRPHPPIAVCCRSYQQPHIQLVWVHRSDNRLDGLNRNRLDSHRLDALFRLLKLGRTGPLPCAEPITHRLYSALHRPLPPPTTPIPSRLDHSCRCRTSPDWVYDEHFFHETSHPPLGFELLPENRGFESNDYSPIPTQFLC